MLQWVLEEAVPRGHTDFKIAERIMVLNFVAIHTSSVVGRKVTSEAISSTDSSTPCMAEHLARSLAPRGGAKVLAAPARRGRVYCSRRRMDQSSDGQDVED